MRESCRGVRLIDVKSTENTSMTLSSDESESNIVTKFVNVRVDHFDKNNNEAWSMQYRENTEFFVPDAPIYIFVGGNEVMKSDRVLKEGLMYELAGETQGAMFCSEHRYYGLSIPHYDLIFLCSRQAVVDLYILIIHIKNEPKYANSKVVLVGGSYGGSLAVWTKAAFPNEIAAVIASGAPLLAKADFFEYFLHISVLMWKVHPTCVTEIQKDISYSLLLLSEGKYNELGRREGICEGVDMDLIENQQLFLFSKALALSEGAVDGIPGVYRVCRHYTSKNGPAPKDAPYVKVIKDNGCYNYDFRFFIAKIKHEGKYIRNWMYQCCNEFGFFPTSSGMNNQMNSKIPVDFFISICSSLFGSEFTKARVLFGIENTNKRYGGLTPNVTNVIFSHGDLDPWLNLGKVQYQSLTKNALIIIRNGSHCGDLLPIGPHSSVQLIKARQEEKKIVKEWLGLAHAPGY